MLLHILHMPHKRANFIYHRLDLCLTKVHTHGLSIATLTQNLWVFNTTFNNISATSWKCFICGLHQYQEKTTVTDRLYHIKLHPVHFAMLYSAMREIQTHNIWVICPDSTGSCKCNYYTSWWPLTSKYMAGLA